MLVSRSPTRILLALGLLLASPASADRFLYKCLDKGGQLRISDTPCASGERATKWKLPEAAPAPARPSGPPASIPSPPLHSRPAEQLLGLATVTLADGSHVELWTPSMQSARGLTWHLRNDLMLPNGVSVPYAQMRSIEVLPGSDQDRVRIQIRMLDGTSSKQTIGKPITRISGETSIGPFSMALDRIQRVEFR